MSDDLSGFSLYELFRTEAESQTAILNEGILALEQSGNSPTAIEPLMRGSLPEGGRSNRWHDRG